MSTNATVLSMNKIKIVSKSFNIGDLTIIITLSDCVGETIKGFLSSLRSSSFFPLQEDYHHQHQAVNLVLAF